MPNNIDTDEHGFPILLATKAPGQVAAQPDPSGVVAFRGAASGNPNFDPATGRFGGQKTGAQGGTGDASLPDVSNQYISFVRQQFPDATSWAAYPSGTNATIKFFDKDGNTLTVFDVPSQNADQATLDQFQNEKLGPETAAAEQERVAALGRLGIPQGVTPDEWEKRISAVRDAAREMDDMSEGDAKDFLAGRAGDVSKVDVAQFLKDVREQRIDDLTDILDQQLRGTVDQMKRSRRTVRLVAPRGWTKRVFAGLNDEEVVKLLVRLEGKGWDPKDLTDNIISRVQNEERRAKIEQLFGERKKKSGKKADKIAAEDPWNVPDPLELEATSAPAVETTPPASRMELEDVTEAFGRIAERLPAPVIHVHPPPQGLTHKSVKRDERGRITDVIEEPTNG